VLEQEMDGETLTVARARADEIAGAAAAEASEKLSNLRRVSREEVAHVTT